MRKDKREDSQGSSPHWMTTYADMVTLLLTFFVLLISFSTISEIKFDAAISSLKGALGVLDKSDGIVDGMTVEISTDEVLRRKNLYEDVMKLKEIAKELGYEEDVSIEATGTGMLIQLGDRVLFDLGKADLKPEAYPILEIIGKTVKEQSKEVLVCGHTDDLPINTPKFPSNWELSTARAVTVVKYLINSANVPPEILGATGYSEYRPLVPNDSPENRKKNRRVEFLVTWK